MFAIINTLDGSLPDHRLLNLLFSWQNALVACFCIGLLSVLRVWHRYHTAYAQFPGPPVKNFWVGNLDQTMADDVHEKVSPLSSSSSSKLG